MNFKEVAKLSNFEIKASTKSLMPLLKFLNADKLEAGCDEAGRGCLAGPVVAASVILDRAKRLPSGLNDSKKLSPVARERLYKSICKAAMAYQIVEIDNNEIDSINILQASVKAMHEAAINLDPTPEHLLIDGHYFKNSKIPFTAIIKGDAKYASIAAASILAKVHRDRLMCELNKDYPQYQWASNKGYPSKAHRDAIEKYGISPFHRKSFRLLKDATQLELKL